MPSYEGDSVTSPDGITHLTQMNPTLREQKHSTSSGNITLATKSTSTLIHTRSIAHPQEHHTCYEVNADTDSSQKHSTSSGNITHVTKPSFTPGRKRLLR